MSVDFLVRFRADGRQVGTEASNVVSRLNAIQGRVSAAAGGINQKLTGMLGSGMAGLLGVGVITEAARRTIDYAGAMADLSDKTQLNVESLQAFDAAAKQSGSSVEEVAAAIKKIAINQVSGLNGSKKDLDSFATLGVSLSDLKSKNPEELFLQISRAIETSKGGARELAAVVEIMGRNADNLLPAMRSGFATMAEEAKKAGNVMSSETVAALDAVGDRITQVAGKMVTVMGPAIAWVADRVRDVSDLLELTVGGIATSLGTMSAGVGLKASLDAGTTFARDVIDKRIRDDKALQNDANRRKKTKVGSDTDPTSQLQQPTHQTNTVAASDALGRIGLFVGWKNPLVEVGRQQIQELRGMKSELKEQTRTLKEGLS